MSLSKLLFQPDGVVRDFKRANNGLSVVIGNQKITDLLNDNNSDALPDVQIRAKIIKCFETQLFNNSSYPTVYATLLAGLSHQNGILWSQPSRANLYLMQELGEDQPYTPNDKYNTISSHFYKNSLKKIVLEESLECSKLGRLDLMYENLEKSRASDPENLLPTIANEDGLPVIKSKQQLTLSLKNGKLFIKKEETLCIQNKELIRALETTNFFKTAWFYFKNLFRPTPSIKKISLNHQFAYDVSDILKNLAQKEFQAFVKKNPGIDIEQELNDAIEKTKTIDDPFTRHYRDLLTAHKNMITNKRKDPVKQVAEIVNCPRVMPPVVDVDNEEKNAPIPGMH